MNFGDIIKKSVLEGFADNEVTTPKVIVTLGITFLIALYIFLVYRMTTKNVFYSKGFAISMTVISVVTAGIILAMQSNIVISLGMVGALSIVRFRTAIKDPMDLLFLFWSIGTGIICGASLYGVAAICALAVTVALLLLSIIPLARAPYLLVISGRDASLESSLIEVVKKYSHAYQVKSRNLSRDHMDMVIQLRVQDGASLLKEAAALEGVEDASLLSHDGETAL
ncbi:MAG: DUF4956 domain-containing protein [Clostridiales bacterium]|nr:DUF4956 domain-containing protein [Clostridiales bacterium]